MGLHPPCFHRVIEWLKLEKATEIILSNRQPIIFHLMRMLPPWEAQQWLLHPSSHSWVAYGRANHCLTDLCWLQLVPTHGAAGRSTPNAGCAMLHHPAPSRDMENSTCSSALSFPQPCSMWLSVIQPCDRSRAQPASDFSQSAQTNAAKPFSGCGSYT